MPVTPEGVKAPQGLLEDAFFPDGDIDERIAAYIEEGEGKIGGVAAADQDEAVKAWVYYRAFGAVVLRQTIEASEQTLDSGKTRVKWSDEQLREFRRERDRWLATFTGYLPDTNVAYSTVAVRTQIHW